jgi:hypothetical protein
MRISENPVSVLARKCYCRVQTGDCGKYRGNNGMGLDGRPLMTHPEAAL